MKPIALQMYSLRERAKDDLAGVLKEVAAMGYVGVEMAGLYDHSASDVRKMLDDLQLVCCSSHGAMPSPETISKRADEAATLGTDMILSSMSPKDFETVEARAKSVDLLAVAAKVAADAGMKFGYHNHAWEMDVVDGATGFDVIMREVPEMFSELDVYWASNYGTIDVPELLERYAPRVPLLHIKDGSWIRDAGFLAVGDGKMDIPAVVAAADANVLRWLIVEIDRIDGDMTEAVEKSVRYLIDNRIGRGNGGSRK